MQDHILSLFNKGASTYCEKGIGIFATQPFNALSNMAVIISAFLSFQYLKSKNIKNRIILSLPLLILFIGLGSMLWHGMPNSITRWLDTIPIIIFSFVVCLYCAQKIMKPKLAWLIQISILVLVLLFIIEVFPSWNGFLTYLIAFSYALIICGLLVKKGYTSLKKMSIVALLLLLAFLFRTLDLPLCAFTAVSTHFLWHIIASLLFYHLIKFIYEIELNTTSNQKP